MKAAFSAIVAALAVLALAGCGGQPPQPHAKPNIRSVRLLASVGAALTPTVGQQLVVSPGSWSGNPTRFTYQWRDCDSGGNNCVNIPGATGSSYVVQASDEGDTLDCVIVAWNNQGSASQTSPATGVVPGGGGGGLGLASAQSVAFYPAWEGPGDGTYVSTTPWAGVTMAVLFSLGSCNGTGTACSATTSFSTVLNGINNVNVANWVSTVHQHNRLAIISIGGAVADNGNGGGATPNWEHQCADSTTAATFTTNLVNYMVSNGFDGIDWDMEQDPGTGSPTLTDAMLINCVSDLQTDLAATKTAADATPISIGEIDPTTNSQIGVDEKPYLNYFDMESYGVTCGSTCSTYNADAALLEGASYGHIPANQIMAGMDTDPGDAPNNPQASNPADCTKISDNAATTGLAGVQVWTEYGDEFAHAGVAQCLTNMASDVQPPFPVHGETLISGSGSATTATSGTVVNPVSGMVDPTYDSEYRCTPTCAGILHFTTAPSGNSVVSWYNDANDFWASNPILGDPNFNLPKTFTIDGCAASCTGSPPASGWTTLKTVTNNLFNGGQYQVNLGTGCGGAACTWLRMDVTAETGSTGNTDASWHMDVAQCSSTCDDTWLFLGDSITNNSMAHDGTPPSNFIDTINASQSAFFPSQIEGGVSFSRLCDWLGESTVETGGSCPDGEGTGSSNMITTVLNAFPAAHFVTLNLGTNDIDAGFTATEILTDYETLVKAVIDAGRVPVVPTIPWAPTSCNAGLNADNPATSGTANYKITHDLYNTFPQIVHGPDLWTFFDTHQSEINTSNCPHPTTTGQGDYRSLWATTMLSAVYP